MVANANYWRGKPTIDRVTWRPVPEATARIAALLTGEAQLVEGVPVELVDVINASGQAQVVKVRNGGLTIYLGLKSAEAPLNDVRVRRALTIAIDRRGIVDEVLRGYATATGSQTSPFDFGYAEMPPPPYDPAGAKKLLADAGFPNGFAIKMQVPRRYMSSAEVGQAIAQQFAAIGVRAELEVPEWSVYAQQVPAGRQAPIYMLAWGSTQTLDADAALFAILRSGEPYSTYSNPTMDKLMDESRATIAPQARGKLFGEIQLLVADDLPLLPLYQEDALYARSAKVIFAGRPDARIPVFDIRVSP